jgi:hypothetical protein
LRLRVGVVPPADRQLVTLPVPQHVRQIEDVRQHVEPRPARCRQPGQLCRLTRESDHPAQVRTARLGVRVRGGGDDRRAPQDGVAEPQLVDVDLGGWRLDRGHVARVGALEAGHPPRTRLRVTATGDRRIDRRCLGGAEDVHAVGLGGAEDVDAVGLVGHAQGDPEVRVRPQVLLDHAGGALRVENEVQPERAAPLRHVDHPTDELGDLVNQGCELVDDDDEARRGGRGRPLLQVREVLRAEQVEDPLAADELRTQRRQRAPHQVGTEVGDQPDAVRQAHAVLEGRPALVVDEEEVHPRRAVRARHAEDPGLEELRLPRAGGAADQAVRPLRAQVEVERVAAGLTDEGPQPPLRSSRPRVRLRPAVEHALGVGLYPLTPPGPRG